MSGAEAQHNDSEGETEHTSSAWPVIQMFPVRHCKVGCSRSRVSVTSLSAFVERNLSLDQCFQVVHFVRHGEGYHNVAGKKDYSQYKRWDLEDAHLTAHGWEQVSPGCPAAAFSILHATLLMMCLTKDSGRSAAICMQAHALRKHLAQLPEPLNVEAVIMSPLSRALQTAVGAFGGDACQSGDPGKVLMVAQDAVPEKQVQHEAVSSAGCPPFIAWEVRMHVMQHVAPFKQTANALKRLCNLKIQSKVFKGMCAVRSTAESILACTHAIGEGRFQCSRRPTRLWISRW